MVKEVEICLTPMLFLRLPQPDADATAALMAK